jgi:tetratricopeptide (TPR) repeat protein
MIGIYEVTSPMISPIDENKENCNFKKALNLLSASGLDGAMMVVERELEKCPDSWEALGAKADILYFQEMYSSALQCCERSLKLNTDNALTWNTKGNVLFKLKRYEDAIHCYNQAIDIEPLFVRAWYNKKLALEVQIKRSTQKISLSGARSQESKKGLRFNR